MAENIRMDSHKLIYHPDAVARWLKGENIYPIEIEISPSGACNHRCIFCAVDYIGYQPDFLDRDTILRDIQQMGQKGLKSVICSGEGEPLLNKDMPDIANGMAAAYISQGADIIYIYNQFINPYVSAEDPWNKRTHTMIRRIGNGETIFNSRRRHVVTFQEQEIVPAGFEAYHPLPMSLSRDETKELSLPIGYVPDGKSARLIIGLSYGTEKNLEIQLNGKRCDTLTECDAETLVSLEANTPGSRMIGEDTTLYMVKIPAESLLRYNLTFTARYDDVDIEYVEVDIQ